GSSPARAPPGLPCCTAPRPPGSPTPSLHDALPILNNREKPPSLPMFDDPERAEPSLDTLVPANPNTPYDMRELITKVADEGDFLDRKSTRLNSSHVKTSHAGFCLNKQDEGQPTEQA